MFISKIIGFIRDILIANIFGINKQTDAFYTAFKLPNMLRKIFAEGTFSYVFIPLLSKYKENKNKKKIKEFISSIYYLLFIILILISILGIIYSKNIILYTSPGFIKDKFKTNFTIKILKIIFPYIILISLTSCISSILNVWNIFIYPTFTPIILNIFIIIFTILSNKFKIPILLLSWSIIIGSISQLFYQKIILKKIPIKIKLKYFNIFNKGIKKIFINIIPVIIGMIIFQISQIMNNSILSYLESGSISWIYYADRLIELPLSILGTTISIILLSKLSNNYNKNNIKKYKKIINKYLRITLILSIPISIILILISKFFIITLFKYGKFNFKDVIMTSKALIAYSIGLTGLILVKIITTCFYSINDTKTPTKISIFTLIFTQILNIITLKLFKHAGLALSISISSYINTIILCWKLKKKNILNIKYNWFLFFIKILLSSIIMIIFIKTIIKENLINYFINLNFAFRLINLSIIILISIIIYIICLIIFKINIKEIIK